jgi:hypothetical protein
MIDIRIQCTTIGLAEFEQALLYRREAENISSNFFLSSLSRLERKPRHFNSSAIQANLKDGIVLPIVITHLLITVNTSSADNDKYLLTVT